MRLLVTGAGGFVGRRLFAREANAPWAGRVVPVAPPPGFDLTDSEAVLACLDDTAPDAVLHLAAQSNVPAAWADPARTYLVNVVGTVALCAALAERRFAGPVLLVGTSDAYGLVPEADLPIPETRPLAPRNPYAASKQAAEAAALQWRRSHDLRLILARPFNHTGPGQAATFVLPALARQVALAALGRIDRLLIGNLDATRDFSFVDDMVDAYVGLIERGAAGETYNVCSGREQRIRDLLDRMTVLAGIDVPVEIDRNLLRPQDQPRVQGDNAKLRACLGTVPAPLDDTHLRLMVDHWRGRELSPPETKFL